jgi:hypothetical protein
MHVLQDAAGHFLQRLCSPFLYFSQHLTLRFFNSFSASEITFISFSFNFNLSFLLKAAEFNG